MGVLDQFGSNLRLVQGPSGVAATAVPQLDPKTTGLQQQVGQAFTPQQFGAHVPEDIGKPMGSFGGSVEAGWRDGIIGFLNKPKGVLPQERDQLEQEGANYAEVHGFRNFIGQSIGGMASDAPIEIGLILAGGPMLGVASKALKAKGFLKAANRIDSVRDKIKLAELGKAKLTDRAKYEATIGALAGVISETSQQQLGKAGGVDNIIDRGLQDAVGSVLFSEAIRLGGKAFNKFKRPQAIDDLKAAVDETPAVGDEALPTELSSTREQIDAEPFEADIPTGGGDVKFRPPTELPDGSGRLDQGPIGLDEGPLGLDEGVPTLDEGDIRPPRTEDIDSAMSNMAGVDPKDPALKDVMDAYNKNKSEGGLKGILDRILPEDSKHLSQDVIDFMSARAEAAKMTLDNYLKTKNINFGESTSKISTQFAHMKQTINAVENATSIDDFIHELGHIYRADLSDVHTKTIEGRYGIKGGVWDRASEERFAEDFMNWVREGEGAKGFSRNLRRAFQALSDWLKSTVGVLLGKGIDTSKVDPEVAEIFGGLFTKSEDIPTPEKEAFVFGQRNEQSITELFAPNPEWAAMAADAQANAARVVEEAHSDETGIKSGSAVPKTKAASRFWKVASSFNMFGVDNLSVMDVLSGFGKTFQESILEPMKVALDQSSEIKVNMRERMSQLNISDAQHAKFKAESDVTLGGKTKKLSGLQRLSIYLSLTDGTDADFNWNGNPTAGYARIVKGFNKKGEEIIPKGIKVDGDIIVLDRLEAEKLISEGGLLDADELRIADEMQDIYQDSVPWINQTYQRLVGSELIKGEGQYRYSPLRSLAEDGEETFDDLVSFNDILQFRGAEGEKIDMAGSIKGRAKRTLDISDPFQQMNTYINTVPDSVAYAEPVKIGLESIDAIGAEGGSNRDFIIETYGKKTYENLKAQMRNLVGDRKGIKGPGSPKGSYLINLANMSKLALNPTTALKQWGSIWTAKASGVLKSMNSAKVWADTASYIIDVDARKQLLDEAIQTSPFFANRQMGGYAFIDDNLLQTDEFARLMLTRENEPSVADLIKLAKDNKVSKSSAWAEIVSRGLKHIKIADEAAMAALFKAVKEDVDINGGDINAKFRDLILESQPSYDNLSRSMNQLNRDLLSRSLAAFSTQTRKNAVMFNKAFYNLINKEEIKAKDVQEFLDVSAPLLFQTAYATAAGTVGAIGTGAVITSLESPEVAKRNEKLRMQTTEKILQRFGRDLLGQQPVVGSLATYVFARATGAPAFSTGIIGLSDFEKIADSIKNKEGELKVDPAKAIRAFSGLLGSSTAGKLIATQVQE